MPLHAEQESIRAIKAEGFNETVRRGGFHGEGGRQAVYALAVEAVHPCPIHAGKQMEHAAGSEGDLVGGGVLVGEAAGRLAVVVQAGLGMDLLVEGSAEGDVDLLETSADAQDGDAEADGLLDERKGDAVPGGVRGRIGVLEAGAVVFGGYVAERAG